MSGGCVCGAFLGPDDHYDGCPNNLRGDLIERLNLPEVQPDAWPLARASVDDHRDTPPPAPIHGLIAALKDIVTMGKEPYGDRAAMELRLDRITLRAVAALQIWAGRE